MVPQDKPPVNTADRYRLTDAGWRAVEAAKIRRLALLLGAEVVGRFEVKR